MNLPMNMSIQHRAKDLHSGNALQHTRTCSHSQIQIDWSPPVMIEAATLLDSEGHLTLAPVYSTARASCWKHWPMDLTVHSFSNSPCHESAPFRPNSLHLLFAQAA
jgi:hypothetical protein